MPIATGPSGAPAVVPAAIGRVQFATDGFAAAQLLPLGLCFHLRTAVSTQVYCQIQTPSHGSHPATSSYIQLHQTRPREDRGARLRRGAPDGTMDDPQKSRGLGRLSGARHGNERKEEAVVSHAAFAGPRDGVALTIPRPTHGF